MQKILFFALMTITGSVCAFDPAALEYAQKRGGQAAHEETVDNYKQLYMACRQSDDIEQISEIIDKVGTADVWCVTLQGSSVLHRPALSDDDCDVIRRAMGVIVSRESALHLAARVGSLEIVKKLYENGAKPSALDQDGQTAYDLASNDDVRGYLSPITAIYY